MKKFVCDRCEKDMEGKPKKKGDPDLCDPCLNEYNKFMKSGEEKKNKIGRFF